MQAFIDSQPTKSEDDVAFLDMSPYVMRRRSLPHRPTADPAFEELVTLLRGWYVDGISIDDLAHGMRTRAPQFCVVLARFKEP